MEKRSAVNPYIVVLDASADAVRVLLFDSEARRVEGYSAQLPCRADAAPLCLDEMHRLVEADGFHIAAVVGRDEREVTDEDRSYWPAFRNARWFPALPEGVSVILGSGCVEREKFALLVGEMSVLATIVDAEPAELPPGLICTPVDEKRWLVSGAVVGAGELYSGLKHSLKSRRSVEEFLETAAVDDPQLGPFEMAARCFRDIHETLLRSVGKPSEVLACGNTLLKSPSWSQKIANALGVPLTLCTEPEPVGRGGALWALERIGAIEHLRALPASVATVFQPNQISLETTK